MKSFYKISFIIAGCLIAVGLIFGLVGTAFGGNRQLHDMVQNGELSFTLGRWNFAHHFITDNVLWQNGGEGYAKESMDENTYLADGIKNLDLRIGAAELNVMPYSKTGEFRISTNYPERFECGIEGSDTLSVRSKGEVRHRTGNTQIELYVPENMNFENVTVDIGAGTVNLYDLICDHMNVQVGAGECTGDRIVVQNLDCNTGVGNLTLTDAQIGRSDITIDIGAADISGKISGDTDIKCNMGSISMDLEGNVQDYNYRVSCSAGSVDIDGETISPLSGSMQINNNSDVTFDVDCSMGNVEIDF